MKTNPTNRRIKQLITHVNRLIRLTTNLGQYVLKKNTRLLFMYKKDLPRAFELQDHFIAYGVANIERYLLKELAELEQKKETSTQLDEMWADFIQE